MRVLIVSSWFPYYRDGKLVVGGGTERYSYDLASGLRDTGYEVSVLSYTPERMDERKEVSGLKVRRFAENDFSITSNLLYCLLFSRPDVVHVVSCGFRLPVLCSTAKLFFRKTILTMQLAGKPSVIPKIFLRLYDRIISPSEETKDLVSVVYPKEKIVVIPNHISPEFRTDATSKPKDKTILYVGRLDYKQKDISLLIASFAEVKKKIRDAKLLLVGPDFGEKQRTLKLIEDLNLKDVVLAGPKTPQELEEIYSHAYLFCIVSAYESFGFVVVEALNYGLPCVASNIKCFTEIIDDGADGFIVERTPKAVAEKIIKLLEDPVFRNRMSAKAKEKSKKYYFKNTLKEILKAYDGLSA